MICFDIIITCMMIRGEREALLARREFLQQLSLWEEDIKIPLPGQNGVILMRMILMMAEMIMMMLRMIMMMILIFSVACYQNDRDRLREFLISWFQISAKKQPWYR